MGVAGSFLERIEVRALHILDDGDLEGFAVPRLDDDDGELVQPCPLGGAPAALASYDLVSVGDASDGEDDDRLDDPALLDRGGELIELRIVEPLSRVARIGTQELIGVWRVPRETSACCGFAPPSKAASPRPRRGRFSVRATASSAMDPSLGFS
jgi:hypothetical protein